MKVSIDFDSTLTINSVQYLVKILILKNIEVHITTSRFEKYDLIGHKVNNDDLYELANELGITNIHFCNMSSKSSYLKDKDFLFHLDDDEIELQSIRNETEIFPIHRREGNDWLNQCLDIIRIYGKKV